MRRRRIIYLGILWFCVWMLLPSWVYAEEELQFDDIIKMLEHAGKQINYLGTKFVIDFTPSQRSTTMVKIAYDASGIQKKEVASLQHGESQIILDDGEFLWHYIPSQASVVKKKRRLSLGELSNRIHLQNELIQQNYKITIEKQEQGEKPASLPQIPSVMGDVVVAFQPKANDRPAWKIWIDSEHGLVVRTEIYDIDGSLALLSAFSDITFQPKLSKKEFVLTVPKGTQVRPFIEKTFQSVEEAQKYTSFTISEPQYLPPGFVLSGIILAKTIGGEKLQLAYIDGMSSISVFEDKRTPSSETADSRSKEVEINTDIKGTFYDQGLLKILNWRLNEDVHVTLIGEVADRELLKIASSITSK